MRLMPLLQVRPTLESGAAISAPRGDSGNKGFKINLEFNKRFIARKTTVLGMTSQPIRSTTRDPGIDSCLSFVNLLHLHQLSKFEIN